MTYIFSGLKQRLADGEHVVCGEGFCFELERRGYLNLGHYIPLAVLDDPDVVRMMHKEFAHAGSNVVEACTVSSSLDIMFVSSGITKMGWQM